MCAENDFSGSLYDPSLICRRPPASQPYCRNVCSAVCPERTESVCIRSGARIADLSACAGPLIATIGTWQDWFYDVILVDVQDMKAVSDYTFRMVQGTNTR